MSILQNKLQSESVNTGAVTSFIRQIDLKYKPTPLMLLTTKFASSIMLKDERNRMGIGSFKAAGGAYAVAKILQHELGKRIGRHVTLEELLSSNMKQKTRSFTFVCASAGNHGLSVANGAKIFGANACVFLPKSAPKNFEARLKSSGAEVHWSGDCYEEAIVSAAHYAKKYEGIYLSDYAATIDEIGPALIMEGYEIIGEEIKNTLTHRKKWPTHVFLQAGVGGFAAALAKSIRQSWPQQPNIIIVEPETAACLARSAIAGKAITITDKPSVMHRLDCKKPSLSALKILTRANVTFVTVSDDEAQIAAENLAELGFPTTPSGAAGFAALCNYSSNKMKPFRPLIFVTEINS